MLCHIRGAISFALLFPALILPMDTGQSTAATGTNQSHSHPIYLIPLEITQRGLAAMCQPFDYDRAARLDGDRNCQEIIQLIKNSDEPFSGLIIAPGGDNEKIINHFFHVQTHALCCLPIQHLLQMDDHALAQSLEKIDSFIEKQIPTIIIFNNLELLCATTEDNINIVHAISLFMAIHKQRDVVFLGICDNAAMIPPGLKSLFTSSWLMPAMNFAQRYSVLQRVPIKFERPQPVIEAMNLAALIGAQEPIRRLYHAQEIGVLAQQTEGFSSSTLQGLSLAFQSQQNGVSQTMLNQSTRTAASMFQIRQTIGSLFRFRFFNFLIRPSVWLRAMAFSPEIILSSSPDNLQAMISLSNVAQYGNAEPGYIQLIKDYAPHVGWLLLRVTLRRFGVC